MIVFPHLKILFNLCSYSFYFMRYMQKLER